MWDEAANSADSFHAANADNADNTAVAAVAANVAGAAATANAAEGAGLLSCWKNCLRCTKYNTNVLCRRFSLHALKYVVNRSILNIWEETVESLDFWR